MDKIRIKIEDEFEGDLEFDAIAEGPADGELVLFLHGFPQTGRCYEAQVAALGAAGYRPVAFDQRGYSPGARPAGVDAYTGRRLVSDVIAVADQLGAERFHLVGHDWGGAIAWQAAAFHPGRLLTLTVLSTPHPMAYGVALAASSGEQTTKSSYIEVFREEGSEDRMLENDAAGLRMVFAASGLGDEKAAPYVEALSTPEALGAALNWYRAISLADMQGMGPISMPTLFVWSTEDIALGRTGAEATAQFVEGPYRFEVLEGVSHWIAEEVPDRVSELLLEHVVGGSR